MASGSPRKDTEEGEWPCPRGGEVFSTWSVALLTPHRCPERPLVDPAPRPVWQPPTPSPPPRELVLGANPGRAGAGAQPVCGEPRSQVRGGSQGNSAVESGSSGLQS